LRLEILINRSTVMRVLLIKMSSLGDMVHSLAGATDAARALPGIQFDWVVEEAYAEVPAWHPAVGRIIPCALRLWRKTPFAVVRNGTWGHFRQELRQAEYDLVLDAQGLMKSALIARQARGPVAGRSVKSAREAPAALLYHRRLPIDMALSEVEQLRQLFALALGYPQPASPANFGIDRARLLAARTEGHAVLLHGAAWPAKLWSEENWKALGRFMTERGVRLQLPWGTPQEHERATRIAEAAGPGSEVLPKLSINELAATLRGARFAVGLDTGLTHIAIALGVPTVTLYGPTVPVCERVVGGQLVNLVSRPSREVDSGRPNTVPLAQVLEAIGPWCS
jgi:lipopolysaccharide heptosyltransferase I